MSPCLPELLTSRCRSTPSAPAVVDGETAISWAELGERVWTTAAALAGQGIDSGDRVAVAMLKSVDQVTALLAVLCANAVLVSVHPALTAAQMRHICDDAGVRLLIVDRMRRAMLRSAPPAPMVLGVEAAAGSGEPSLVEQRGAQEVAPDRFSLGPNDNAALIYTSLARGLPRGVVLSHQTLSGGAQAQVELLGLRAEHRLGGLLCLNFAFGLNQLWQALYSGAPLFLHTFVFPLDLYEFIAEHRLSHLFLMPVTAARMLDRKLGGPPAGADLSSVQAIALAGGRLGGAMLDGLRELFPAAEISSFYGFTEAFPSSWLSPAALAADPEALGSALPGVELLVVDADGALCPAGETGELVHRGAGVALGYWQAAEESACCFRPLADRFQQPTAFSGDLASVAGDGTVSLHGRRDERIKSHGRRVSPEEIEAVALACPQVEAALVWGVEHAAFGQVIALAFDGPDGGAAEPALREHLRAQLPSFLQPAQLHHGPGLAAELPHGDAARRRWREQTRGTSDGS